MRVAVRCWMVLVIVSCRLRGEQRHAGGERLTAEALHHQ